MLQFDKRNETTSRNASDLCKPWDRNGRTWNVWYNQPSDLLFHCAITDPKQANRLQRLEGAVSASYQPDPGPQSKSLLIDLSRFWEILEYSSNSDADSARRLFGDSLYTGPPTFAAEVSQTSPLPEPTRLNSDSALAHHQSFNVSTPFLETDSMGGLVSPRPLDVLNDEFSILATNFFSQGQEFLRNGDSRDTVWNY